MDLDNCYQITLQQLQNILYFLKYPSGATNYELLSIETLNQVYNCILFF